MNQILKVLVFALAFLKSSSIVGQTNVDTTFITFPQVEEIFISNNYRLLAQRFNITASEGAIQQARLWNNPLLFVETNLYNPTNGKVFSLGETPFKWYDGKPLDGQLQVQLNQLFLLGGKRSKMIHLAQTNHDIQISIFSDLLRALHYELYQSFILLYYDLESIKILKEEERQLVRLIDIELIALNKGAISGYEVTRLQFELQDIRKSIKEQLDQVADDENSLRMLLSSDPFVFYMPSKQEFGSVPSLMITQMIDSALSNRPEMKITQFALDYNLTNISLQKAYSIPDLNLGANYDRSGNAWYNYTGINMAINLPLFNRNQGNIKIAEQQFRQSQILRKQTEFTIKEEVILAYQKLENSLNQKKMIQPEYEGNLQDISQAATENYNKRTISLLDYLDKIKTARNAQLNLFNLNQSLSLSQAFVNFTTNSKIF